MLIEKCMCWCFIDYWVNPMFIWPSVWMIPVDTSVEWPKAETKVQGQTFAMLFIYFYFCKSLKSLQLYCLPQTISQTRKTCCSCLACPYSAVWHSQWRYNTATECNSRSDRTSNICRRNKLSRPSLSKPVPFHPPSCVMCQCKSGRFMGEGWC